MMKKLLITGASGFIGAAVTALAVQQPDWQVFALTSGRRPVCFPEGATPVTADLYDPEQRRQVVERVVPAMSLHLVWDLGKKGFLHSPSNLRWLEISLSLLQEFQRSGGKYFLFAGSSSEYGYELEVCAETSTAAPTDLYGRCKLAFSQVAQEFCRANDLLFTDIRYFPIYGPGEKSLVHAIPCAIDALSRGAPFVCKAPNNCWDYLCINDAADATISIMKKQLSGPVNVGSGVGVSMETVFRTVASALHAEGALSFENEHAEGKKLYADITRLRSEAGFRPHMDLVSGIEETVRWWKSSGQR